MRHDDILNNLLTFLEGREQFANAIAIRELKLGIGGARADLAVFGPVLHGFEIKSAHDSTQRLERQLQDYELFFEYNTIIVAEKHLETALSGIRAEIGVMVVEDRSSHSLKLIRKAKKNKSADRTRLLELLWKDELIDCLESNSINGKLGPVFDKKDLRKSLSTRLSKEAIREAVITQLRTRETLQERIRIL